MSARWIVEEEYIEWPETSLGLRFARESRLISPKGEVLARRLAYHAATWENCLFLQDNHCISYREADVLRAGIASLSANLRSLLISNQALLIYDWDFRLLTLPCATEWRLQQCEQVSTYRALGLYQANSITVSTYQCKSLSQTHTMEWRVYSVSEYLGGYPVNRELLMDNHLIRRHRLLYRRSISESTALGWLRLPRGAKPYPASVDWVIGFAGYRVFHFDNVDKAK